MSEYLCRKHYSTVRACGDCFDEAEEKIAKLLAENQAMNQELMIYRKFFTEIGETLGKETKKN